MDRRTFLAGTGVVLLAATLASPQEDGRVVYRWMSAGADLAAAGQHSHLMR
jgi:hypothetical protein